MKKYWNYIEKLINISVILSKQYYVINKLK